MNCGRIIFMKDEEEILQIPLKLCPESSLTEDGRFRLTGTISCPDESKRLHEFYFNLTLFQYQKSPRADGDSSIYQVFFRDLSFDRMKGRLPRQIQQTLSLKEIESTPLKMQKSCEYDHKYYFWEEWDISSKRPNSTQEEIMR